MFCIHICKGAKYGIDKAPIHFSYFAIFFHFPGMLYYHQYQNTQHQQEKQQQALWNWWIKDLLYPQLKMLFNNLLLLFATTDCIWLFLHWSKPQEDKLRKTTSSISQCLRNAIQEAKSNWKSNKNALWKKSKLCGSCDHHPRPIPSGHKLFSTTRNGKTR